MRTETIVRTLYSYDELSDDAKEKALEKLWDINVDFYWYDYITDQDIEASGDVSGLGCVYAGSFDIDNRYFIHIKRCDTTVTELLNNCARTAADRPDFYKAVIAPFFAEFTSKEIKQLLRWERWQICCGLRGETSQQRSGNWSEVEMIYDFDKVKFLNTVRTFCYPRVYALYKKLENAWDDLIGNLESYYLEQLRNEYNYQTSRESVEESIRCNEYEFTEDGTLA